MNEIRKRDKVEKRKYDLKRTKRNQDIK